MYHTKKKRVVSIAFSLVLLVSACQKSSTGPTANVGISPESRWASATGTPTELEGVWSHCRNASGIGSKESLTFRYQEMEYSYVLNASLDCQGPLLEIIGHGTFTLDGESTTLEDASLITFNLTKFYATPLSETISADLNKKAACGISNWTANQTIPIDLTPCSVNNLIKSFTKPNFTIYKIVEGGTLFLGEPSDTLNASSAETRPDRFYSQGLLKVE